MKFMLTAFIELPDEFDFTDGVNDAWPTICIWNDYGPYGSMSKWQEDLIIDSIDVMPVNEDGVYVGTG